MRVADLVLPVFAVIVTGWLVGYTRYLPTTLSDALIHFAYNIAMPALLIVTIAQEPAHSLINWRFLIAFGGGFSKRLMSTFRATWVGTSTEWSSLHRTQGRLSRQRQPSVELE